MFGMNYPSLQTSPTLLFDGESTIFESSLNDVVCKYVSDPEDHVEQDVQQIVGRLSCNRLSYVERSPTTSTE